MHATTKITSIALEKALMPSKNAEELSQIQGAAKIVLQIVNKSSIQIAVNELGKKGFFEYFKPLPSTDRRISKRIFKDHQIKKSI